MLNNDYEKLYILNDNITLDDCSLKNEIYLESLIENKKLIYNVLIY